MKTTCKYSLAVAVAFILSPPFNRAAELSDIPLNAPKSDPKEFLTLFDPGKEYSVTVSRTGHIRQRLCDGSLLRTFYQCNPVGAAISGDGQLFSSAGEVDGRGTLNIWRLDDGKFLCKIRTPIEVTPVLVFSGDGALLAVRVGKTRLSLWEIPSGRLKWSATLNRTISSLAFSHSNDSVIITCSDKGIRRLSAVDGSGLRDSDGEK